MADLNKTTAEHMVPFAGTFGNASLAVFTYELSSAAADDVIYFGKLPKYATVTSVRVWFDDLGTGCTLDVGYKTAEINGSLTADPDYWLADQDVATAASVALSTAWPVTLSEETYVTGLIESASASGTVTVVVEYLYESN